MCPLPLVVSTTTPPTGWSAFWQWEGWTAIGTIATVFALATLVAGAWQFMVQRRQMPLFQLSWDYVGTATEGADAFHVYEFRNVGRGSGELFRLDFAGGYAKEADDFRVQRNLGSGDSFRLLISTPDIGAMWIRWLVRTSNDRYGIMLKWGPLTTEGSSADAWSRDVDEWQRRSYFEIVRDRFKMSMVAPSGRPAASFRFGLSEVGGLEAALGLPDDTPVMYPSFDRSVVPNPIPYVPPPV